jgi:SAM-dependent methyltransferase
MKKKEYIYADYTYNSKNPLARFSHRTRFSVGLDLVLEKNPKSILDYGAGDCKFLKAVFEADSSIILHAYEPVMEVKNDENIKIFKDLNELASKKYDVITCFEVLEHFNQKNQAEILGNCFKMLEDDGKIVISVPIEIGLPSLVKNLRRMSFGHFNWAYLKNTAKCLIGADVPEIRNREGFIPSHLGFNHHKLEKIFLQNFKIEKKTTSPFSILPSFLNAQLFYQLKKTP